VSAYVPDPMPIASIVSLIKCEISSMKELAERLELNKDMFSAVLAVSTGELEYISDISGKLANTLDISTTYAVETIIKIAQ
jgi:hypothetical protein